MISIGQQYVPLSFIFTPLHPPPPKTLSVAHSDIADFKDSDVNPVKPHFYPLGPSQV